MTRPGLEIAALGPAVTLQDPGRPGLRGQGLSPGGAADPLALAEAAALLDQAPDRACLEMAGSGGSFAARGGPLTIALTGAPMAARLDGRALAWTASHRLEPGQRLEIGGARRGTYGYLHVAGGLDVAPVLGSRSRHVAGGLGPVVTVGDVLKAGAGAHSPAPGLWLEAPDRFGGGEVRIVESAQTGLFDAATLARFAGTGFRHAGRANRMGVLLEHDGPGFAADGALSVLSDAVVSGDIQIAGDGAPFVLLGECQTTGGYPRIGTVIPCDLPRVAQAAAGDPLRFRVVSLEEGLAALEADRALRDALAGSVRPLVRDPHDIPDLLSYQLVDGITDGRSEEGV